MLVNKGGKVETEEIISYNQELKAPISAGTVVGKIEIINKENGEKIGESELYVQNDMNKSSFLDYFKKLFELYVMKNNT
jgi:D-alanyl-D-alanine carboxypeptidase